ncbi:hypothetical protein K503DRAFT_583300 [Rhizopogon vinicolor AM-OR11-026]|uniref:VHS domain-containing protein n=1 Tax=Rhizopogon vinicolor AM-OR11-026 TaxID=1314800 RepID=A0A1B7N7F4_9AGAM|nr:hypothetical protein K503DRAFT_583300 [Rhizopogon vinicolor AM-OR11-026]
MKKLFGRDKAKHQKITSHRDVDALIDDDTPPIRPPRPSVDHRDWDMLSDPPVPSSPYPQFAVPITPSRSSSLASLPPVVLPPRSNSPFSTASHTNPAPQISPNTNSPIRRDGRKVHKSPPAPAALGILKALDPHPDQHIHQPRHELSQDSLVIDHKDKAEKKEKKSFWDGIIRDRDRDKDRDRGRDKDRDIRDRDKGRDKDKDKDRDYARERLWQEDNPSELTRMIGYLTATSSEDWTLVLEVCDRACASEANAKETAKALRREFKYAEPKAQLSAARLWAIMLRNASDVFITQISTRKFIDSLEDVLTNSRTNPVVRERLMEVLAAAAFITSSRTCPSITDSILSYFPFETLFFSFALLYIHAKRPHPSPKSEPSPFSLKDRDRDKDGFRTLWMRLKPADKPDVGVPFNTEDAMFSPPIVPARPPIEERPSRKSLHQRGVIPPEEDMKRLFQECKIAKGNANVLSEMLAFAKPEQVDRGVIPEFLAKCRASQELIYTQIPWASAGAERSRCERERNVDGIGRTRSQPELQFNPPPSRDYHGGDGIIYNAEGEEQTVEEELLGALLEANGALLGALRIYEDIMRVVEERVAVEISRKDVKMDRRLMENEYLGESHGGGSSRTPSPISSPPGSPRQHDLPPVVPSQTHPLPRVPPALSPALSHYGSPPQTMSTPTLLAPPPPPVGPRSPAIQSRTPSPDRGVIMHSPRGDSLESMGGALDRLQMDENDIDDDDIDAPIRPSAKALGKRRVVEEVDDDQYDSSDLYYEPRRESAVLDSDEDGRGGDPANPWPRRQPTQYVYDAAAERTAQHLREGRVGVVVNGVH